LQQEKSLDDGIFGLFWVRSFSGPWKINSLSILHRQKIYVEDFLAKHALKMKAMKRSKDA